MGGGGRKGTHLQGVTQKLWGYLRGDRTAVYSGLNCYLFSSSEISTEMPRQGTVGAWRESQGAMRTRFSPLMKVMPSTPSHSTGGGGKNMGKGRKGRLQRHNPLNPKHHSSSCCQVLLVTQDFGPAHMSPHATSQPSR